MPAAVRLDAFVLLGVATNVRGDAMPLYSYWRLGRVEDVAAGAGG